MHMGDRTRVQVDFLGVVRLQLNKRIFLELQDMVYITLIRRNLISVPILDRHGYSFLLELEKLNCTEIHYSLAMKHFVGIFID